MKKILVCMKDSLSRDGLVSVLKGLGYDIDVIASPAEQNQTKPKHFTHIILEICKESDISPFDQLNQLVSKIGADVIILLTEKVTHQQSRQLQSARVNAILSSTSTHNEIKSALVLTPKHFVNNTEITVREKKPDTKITPRELQVLRMIANGCSTKDIANNLGITERTAEAHRYNAMRKLDLHNQAQVANWVNNN